MDQKFEFNEVAAEYDKRRPDYVPELFKDVVAYCPVDKRSRVLEIGMGTGQATRPFLQTNCSLTAVEIGGALVNFARDKFRVHTNLNILYTAFEDYVQSDHSFDLIYAASAFHWIPEQIGYPKVFRVLKSGGAFARFSNYPDIYKEGGSLCAAIQAIYKKYMPPHGAGASGHRPPSGTMAETCRRYGFIDVISKTYFRTRVLNAASYVGLLGTYSDHRALGSEVFAQFAAEIGEAIHRHGGLITVYDTMELQLARKP